MGAGWRRVKEKLRESMPGAHDLTSNARNKTMMKTATEFSQQVRKCEKAIRAAHAANAELLSTTKAVMLLPLPQTYEDSNNGAGTATASMNLVGGPNFKADNVSRVSNESGHKLETEVLAPLQRWQDVHLQLVARFKDLENTRLELDSRRRTVTDMSQKVSSMRAKLGSSGGGAKTEAKLDTTIRTLSHKEAKLKVTTQNFDQQEALLARDLAALIADGQYLKHYVAAALRLQGGALLGAADAFGELTSVPSGPPPTAPSQSGTPTGAAASSTVTGFATVAAAPAPGAATAATAAANPYHSVGSLGSGAAAAGTLAADPRPYNSAPPHPMGSSTTKRFSDPQEPQPQDHGTMVGPTAGKVGLDAVPAARYPVSSAAAPEASDNPYSSARGYTYT